MSDVKYACDERGYINFVEGLVIKAPGTTKKYKMIRQIGKGTFSRVMQCEDVTSGPSDKRKKYVAVKINRSVAKYMAAAKIELEILKSIKSVDRDNTSNCIHLTQCFEYNQHTCFVFPLFGRSVYGFLRNNKYIPFATPHVKQFAWQIIHAIKFMHDYKIIFTDLKPENIVFVKDVPVKTSIKSIQTKLPYAFRFWKQRMLQAGYAEEEIMALQVAIPTDTRLKIIDFGSALFESRWHNHLVQTRHYRAPEVVLGMRWKFPIDIWSIGCIMLEFIYGRMVFNTHDSIDHLNQMETMIGPMPLSLKKEVPREVVRSYFHSNGKLRLENAKISAVQCKPLKRYFGRGDDQMYDLVQRMLRWEPKHRITAEEALRHPYFKDVSTKGLQPRYEQYQTRSAPAAAKSKSSSTEKHVYL